MNGAFVIAGVGDKLMTVVEDVTGDGYPDIIAGGRQTHNVKLYVNAP